MEQEVETMQPKAKTWIALPLILAMPSVLADNPGGQAQEPHSAQVEHATQAAGTEHRDCHQM